MHEGPDSGPEATVDAGKGETRRLAEVGAKG
jgi:hypothetical protein